MSLGTILTSLAALVLVAAYVARPFRRERVDADRVIDGWVRRMRSTTAAIDDVPEPAGTDVAVAVQPEADSSATPVPTDTASALAEPALVEPAPAGVVKTTGSTGAIAAEPIDQDEPVNFCPYCGRRVEPDHVFCPKCGRQLAEGAQQ
jgi:zinc ribbon protein